MSATITETSVIELSRLDSKGHGPSTHRSLGVLRAPSPQTTERQATNADSSSPPTRTTILEDGQHSANEGTAKKLQRKELLQLAALCWGAFLIGWNDAMLGPLIPRIQEVYNVGFTVVSMIFVVACVGFCLGAACNAYFTDRIPFGKFLVLASCFQLVGYSIQSAAPPFALFVATFAINGISLGVHISQSNGYVAALNDHTKMGILHASYGTGAFCSPLVATQFAQMERWSFHFLTCLGMTVSVMVIDTLVFKFRSQDDCLVDIGRDPGEKSNNENSHVKQFMGIKAVHILAAFILVYVGTEVTIGGWTVTYIIQERGGGPSAGYISSGFWAGLAVGRIALLWIGERRVVYLYSALSIGLQIVVWFVPSLVGGAVAVSFIGFLIGPYYPLAMNTAGKILPRWLLTVSIGWIAGIGQAGSAILPFISGVFASKFGIVSLQPFLVVMMVIMVVLWTLVPNQVARRD